MKHSFNIAILCAYLTSCTLSSDLSNLSESPTACPAGDETQLRDLTLDLRAMTAHSTDLFRADVLTPDREGNLSISSRVILEPFGGNTAGDLLLRIPNAVPARRFGPLLLSFGADEDNSRAVEPCPTLPTGAANCAAADHNWLEDLCPDGSIRFIHATNFAQPATPPPGPGVTFSYTARIFDPNNQPPRVLIEARSFELQQLFRAPLEVRLVRLAQDGDQTIGVFRRNVRNGNSETVTIPDIMDTGFDYEVQFYYDIDADGIANGAANPPTNPNGDLLCVDLLLQRDGAANANESGTVLDEADVDCRLLNFRS